MEAQMLLERRGEKALSITFLDSAIHCLQTQPRIQSIIINYIENLQDVQENK